MHFIFIFIRQRFFTFSAPFFCGGIYIKEDVVICCSNIFGTQTLPEQQFIADKTYKLWRGFIDSTLSLTDFY